VAGAALISALGEDNTTVLAVESVWSLLSTSSTREDNHKIYGVASSGLAGSHIPRTKQAQAKMLAR
jgi:hypothetical protein